MKNNRILIVAAHPDDEILGCGGTIARLVEEGNEAYSLILGEGKTSRCANRADNNFEEDRINLRKEAIKANSLIGVKEVYFKDYPDNRFDSVDLIDIVKSIEDILNLLKPDIIFTHFFNDLNIDHRITNNAVLTATRPMRNESVKEIYSFEVLSSTEWNYPVLYSPNVFYNITDTVELKLKAMSTYESELNEYPHPRSLKAIQENAKGWAFKSGIDGYVEAFYLLRKMIL